jgi:hypothetical protein
VAAIGFEAVDDLLRQAVILHRFVFQGSFIRTFDRCTKRASSQAETRPNPKRRLHTVVRLCVHGNDGPQVGGVRHFPRG